MVTEGKGKKGYKVFNKTIILAIDVMKENLFAFRKVITSQIPGCKVLVTSSSLRGLKIAYRENPEGLLIDLEMPKIDGIEVCRRIKTNKDTAHIPVIIIASHETSSELRTKALAAGADDFITKPIDSIELVAKIKVMLRIRRAGDVLRERVVSLDRTIDSNSKSLRESKDKYKKLFESSNDAIFLCDFKGRIFEINRSASEMLGYSNNELLIFNIKSLHQEKARLGVKVVFIATMKTGNYSYETCFIRKDGNLIDVEISSSVFDIENKLLQLIVRDISGRKQSERVSEKNRIAYQELYENAPVGYQELDMDGRIGRVNKTEATLLGYSPHEMLGKHTWQFVSKDHRALAKKSILEKLTNKSVLKKVERKLERKDGVFIWVSISDRHILDDIGEIKGLRSTLEDITERKSIEQVLLESELRYRSIAETSPDAIITTDRNGKIITWNLAAQKTFGFTEDEIVGKPVEMIMPDGFRGCHKKNMENFVLTQKSPVINKTVELNGVDKSGKEFPIELSLSTWEIDKERFFSAIIRDISSRKNMEKMLIQSEKMASIGVLAAGIAHEINNPIGFIDSNLSTMARYCDKIKEYFSEVQNLAKAGGEEKITLGAFVDNWNMLGEAYNIKRLLYNAVAAIAESLDGTARVKRIISDLRYFARNEKSEFEPVDINEILGRVLDLVRNELKYNIQIIKEFGSSSKIEGDPQRLAQVFVNLLVNAAQAIEQNGVIKIKTSQTRNAISVQISDNGNGIPEKNLGKIFDVFFTTKDPGKGIGMGLSISSQIIQQHNGKIEVESTEGKGTTFTVTLPLRRFKPRV